MCAKDIPLIDSYSHLNLNKKNVQFVDQLNKDHNRHLVLNQSIHRKQSSNETLTRVQQANQRWNHFFNWNLSILDLVAKYFDQLNLCQQCVTHFITEPIDEQQSLIDSDDDDDEE
jgi:hypothetical protein